MAIDQTEIALQQTAPAVIFLPEKVGLTVESTPVPGRNIYWLSKMTALANHDLMPSGHACLSQVGLSPSGELLSLDRKIEDRPADEESLTLIFDVRRQSEGIYGWELTHTRSSERITKQLEVTPANLTGNEYRLDEQGVQRKASEIDEAGLKQLILDISNLLEHPLTIARQVMFARQKSQMESSLYCDQTNSQIIKKRERYYIEQKEHERNVRDFGQTALKMYEPRS